MLCFKYKWAAHTINAENEREVVGVTSRKESLSGAN